MIVLGTVLINATTARLVARLLGVIQDSSNGVLILGANGFAVTIGEYLMKRGREVFLVDSNPSNIRRARAKKLRGIEANIYTSDLSEEYDLLDVGYLLALTGSNDVNEYAIRRYESIFGERGAYRLITPDELKAPTPPAEMEHIFSFADDFINLSEAHRESAVIHERPLSGQEELVRLLQLARRETYSVPLFLKAPDGTLQMIPHDIGTVNADEGGYQLVYLGVKLAGAETGEGVAEAREKA